MVSTASPTDAGTAVRRRPAAQRRHELTMTLFGAAAFQYLNAGCELGLFDLLEATPDLRRSEIRDALGLASRAADILLLGTTALNLTAVADGTYRNGPAVAELYEGGLWQDFAHVVAFEAHIVYESQADFVQSLRENRNVGLRRIRGTGRDLYHRFAENPDLERVFYRYMHSWSELANDVLLDHVDFSAIESVVDVGGGDGVNAIALARAHPHLRITILEIPATVPIAQRTIAEQGLSERITVRPCDFFADPYPTGHDCIMFSHQLVIWTPEQNVQLLRRAYEGLDENGRVVIFNSISSDGGDGPLMAALDSVYFAALPAEGGMIYAWHQYEEWLRAAGFTRIERRGPRETWTPHGVLVAAP